MGKKNRRGGDKSKSQDVWVETAPATLASEKFEAYYRAQGIVPEDQWPALLEAARRPLPVSFRVAGSRQTAQLLNDIIKHTHVNHLQSIVHEDEPVKPPTQLSWYPDGLAWQFTVPKAVLRKNPDFRRFQSFLVYETEVGNISRQESVSMLPPLFLDVQPHHKVLDMCAAPGSKTAQLLEALHSLDPTGGAPPSGLLLANDSDNKRAHLLIHQSSRLPSPAFAVTNLDASHFPSLSIPDSFHPDGTPDLNGHKQPLLFDRILCDVPCSGDGTLRKNIGIWAKWSPQDGNGLHNLQLRILSRALRLLRPGGRLVYSTCSLNPVENEAVVASALTSLPPTSSGAPGAVLLDMSTSLPGLIHHPGVHTWLPSTSDTGREVRCEPTETWATYTARLGNRGRLASSHFPPSADIAKQLALERCMRILPHDQDTGGFFVAVIEKAAAPEKKGASMDSASSSKRAAEAESAEEPVVKRVKLDEETLVTSGGATPTLPDSEEKSDVNDTLPQERTSLPTPAEASVPSTSGESSYKEAPFTFLTPDDPTITACLSQLPILPSFPRSHLYARAGPGDPVRALYHTTPVLHALLASVPARRLRLLSAGARVFVRQGQGETERFRMLAEGLPVVRSWLRESDVITSDLRTLRSLMETYYPLCTTFAQPFRSIAEARDTGSHVVRFAPEEVAGGALPHELLLPIWKSNVSVSLMLDKKAKSALSMRVFGEDITLAAQAAAKARQERKLADAQAGAEEEDSLMATDEVTGGADSAVQVAEEVEEVLKA